MQFAVAFRISTATTFSVTPGLQAASPPPWAQRRPRRPRWVCSICRVVVLQRKAVLYVYFAPMSMY